MDALKWWQQAVFYADKQPRLLFSSQARENQPFALDWLILTPFEIVIAELA